MFSEILFALIFVVPCGWFLWFRVTVAWPQVWAAITSPDTFSTFVKTLSFVVVLLFELVLELVPAAIIWAVLSRAVERISQDLKARSDPEYAEELKAYREREAMAAALEAEERRERQAEKKAEKKRKAAERQAEREREQAQRQEGRRKERARVHAAERLKSASELVDLYGSDPTSFERFVALVYRGLGYTASVTPARNDGGYDIRLAKRGPKGAERTCLVECKCFSPDNHVGRPLLQKLYGANATEHADELIFVTTSSFSDAARRYAAETGIKTVDGDGLVKLATAAGVTRKDAEGMR